MLKAEFLICGAVLKSGSVNCLHLCFSFHTTECVFKTNLSFTSPFCLTYTSTLSNKGNKSICIKCDYSMHFDALLMVINIKGVNVPVKANVLQSLRYMEHIVGTKQ